VRHAVEELGATGALATVLYRSPTQVVDASGIAVRNAGAAMEAAVLGFTDGLPYSAISAVCEAAVVGHDAGGESPRTHVVAAAEREDVAEAIADMVGEAGLTLASVTPIEAAVTARLLAEALSSGDDRTARLYVGAACSTFVVVRQRRIVFNRRIDLGVESLAASLTRPIKHADQSDAVELTPEDARAILLAHGIPARDLVVHPGLRLTGAQVLPLLQPVLQRFVVELRQSLRFGLAESDRTELSIAVTGPGAAIPGFVALIGGELGVATTRDEAYDIAPPGGATRRSELTDALAARSFLRHINLLPREMARQRRSHRLRRWLWIGGTAAIAMIGADALRTRAQLHRAQQDAETYQAQVGDIGALDEKGRLLQNVLMERRDLEALIDTEVGARVNFPVCMRELASLTPATIRLTTIGFTRSVEETRADVSGCALDVDGDESRNDLEKFIDSLRQSPLFRDVTLGHVSRGGLGSRMGQRFDASFAIVPFGGSAHDGMSAAAAREGSPP
jgi:Tfp pilus assembly protein PilN